MPIAVRTTFAVRRNAADGRTCGHADLNTTGHHASTGCIARRGRRRRATAARRRPRAAPVPFRAAWSTAKRLCICRWFKVGVVHSSSRLDRECRAPSRCRRKFRIGTAVTPRSQLTTQEPQALSAVDGQRTGSVWRWWRRYASEQDRCQDLLWLARISKAIPSDADVPPPTNNNNPREHALMPLCRLRHNHHRRRRRRQHHHTPHVRCHAQK